jgi:hypothetical protein
VRVSEKGQGDSRWWLCTIYNNGLKEAYKHSVDAVSAFFLALKNILKKALMPSKGLLGCDYQGWRRNIPTIISFE